MNPILSPIKFNESASETIANLQAILLVMLSALGFADFDIPAAELDARRVSDGTVKGIRILRDKFPAQYNTELLVDELLAKLINDFLAKWFIVRGKLTDAQQQGLAGHIVQIAEYDLDSTAELGKLITRKDGSFALAFEYTERLQKADAQTRPDLLFRAVSPAGLKLFITDIFIVQDGTEQVVDRLTDSPKAPIVVMNVAQETTVRVVATGNQTRLTEFEQLVAALSPFIGQRNVADLKEDEQNFQISFLSRESGIEKASIERLKAAFTEERVSGLPAWAFFGLASIPLTVPEWPEKTGEEFSRILRTMQPSTVNEDLEALAEKLIDYAKTKAVQLTVAELTTAATPLLSPILLNTVQLNSFLTQYVQHEGTPQEFWQSMEQNEEFTELVPAIQLNLQLSQLTLGNAGLVKALTEKGISETKQLVTLTHDEWQELIRLHPDEMPEHITAETVEERTNQYANELQTLVEVAFPTEVIKQQSVSDGVKKFLAVNTDFDVTKNPVETYLQTRGEAAWQDIDDKETVANELRQTQRLYAITTSASDTNTLATMGFKSALQISKMTLSDFTQTVAGKISDDNAALYHTKASAISEAAVMTYMQLRDLALPQTAQAVGDADEPLITIPNWENLFGQIATCECEHCRSVYSPAAYFVDLLHILLGQKGGKARLELFRRRPDLRYTKLSCEHTDTLIPYIDLVNEILETYVAQNHLGDGPADSHASLATNDTSVFTEAELAANPQHPNAGAQADADLAYQLVAQATFPLNMPFDLSLETARQFLLNQSSSRYALMTTVGQADSAATSAEGLGLSELELRLLAGKKRTSTVPLVEEDWAIAPDLFGYEAADIPAGLGEKVKPVREFLERTGLAYTDLVALVETSFLNGNRTIGLILEVPASVAEKDVPTWQAAHACDLSVTSLIHLDATVLTDDELARFNRFIRLWKKMGCSIQDLDLMLTAVDSDSLKEFTPALLNDLSQLWQLKQTLKLSAEQAAALIGRIPTQGDTPLFNRLFLNKAILQIDDKFELTTDRSELLNATEPLQDHQAALLAAFWVSEQELIEVAEAAGINLANAGTLTLANLSDLYRYILFTRINGLKVHDFGLLLPFALVSGWKTVAELLKVQAFIAKLARNDVNAAAIAYLFGNTVEPGSTLPPKPEIIQAAANELREGLLKIAQSTQPDKDTVTADFLKAQLGLLADDEAVTKIIGILDGSNVKADPEKDLPAIAPADGVFLQNPPLPAEYTSILDGYLTALDLTGISDEKTAAGRFDRFWQALSARLIPHLQQIFSKQYLVAQFKTEADRIAFLFDAIKGPILDLTKNTPATKAVFESVYIELFKVTWLINKLKLTAAELAFFQENSVEFDGFNWKLFTSNQLTSWLRIADYSTLRDSLPNSNSSLISVFEIAKNGGDSDAIVKALISATGYDETNVRYFVSKRPTTDFTNEKALLTLQSQVALSKRIGVSIEKLVQWSGDTVDFSTAQDIKRTLKANYDESAWVEISARIHNQLRNEQRDALVDYLLQKPEVKAVGIKTTDDLYAYFLIDVEMNAIVKTSRLKQAISSIQLFVQRCILNLEPGVLPTDIDANQWGWMKLYRVWEANRKVFLYAENWIEPELRDNKSPFFKDLESELLQSEVTSESVETALMNYLIKLDNVARLDICGTFEDNEAKELHVFGRTFNTAPEYYYRKLDLQTHEWTAWEKVQVDIQGIEDGDATGVHLIPVVWNRRLYVFWPLFTERIDKEKQQQDKDAYKQWKINYQAWQAQVEKIRREKAELAKNGLGNSKTEPAPPPEPPMEVFPRPYWEIKLAWSEYKSTGWSAKKVSSSFIRTPTETYAVAKPLFYRFAVKLGTTLRIQLFSHPYMLFDMGAFQFTCHGQMAVSAGQDGPAKIDVISPKQVNFYQGLLSATNSGRDINWHMDDSLPLVLTDYGLKQKEILKKSSKEYKVMYSSDHTFFFNSTSTFFYQDQQRNYYAEPRQEWYNRVVPSLVDRTTVTIPAGKIDKKLVAKPFVETAVSPLASLASQNRLPSISVSQANKLFEEESISVNTANQFRSERTLAKPAVSISKEYASLGSIIGRKYLGGQQIIRSVSKVDFKPFFHAYVCDFMKTLNQDGIDGLLTLANQLKNDTYVQLTNPFSLTISTNFQDVYRPNVNNVSKPYPVEDVDFSPTGAYSLYNWELFFHIPMLLANRLSKNQKFEEAMRWYQFVFDPTTHDPDPSTRRYWQVVPLRNTPPETLQVLLQQLNKPASDPKRQELEKAIEAWRNNPFNPHLIARMRLVAYQKNVLMKYLDNLIAWADNLFRQDTIETINQATQLYIIASEFVKKVRETIPARGTIPAKTYEELETAGLNAFSNALVQMETTFPFFDLATVKPGSGGATVLATTVPADYFGLPNNPKLLAYWDTIADRLFKIRHSLNIEGVDRQLALYEAPLDPALLVQAFAKGIDISSILADLNAPLPYYRFGYIVQKALEICSELRSLGSTLLSILEKKDGEALSMMRTEQETTLLNLAKTVKQLQIREAQRNREGLEKTKDITQHRADFYTLLASTNLIDAEKENFRKLELARDRQEDAYGVELAANLAHIVPNFNFPAFGGSFGGTNVGSGLEAWAKSINNIAAGYTYEANRSSTNASHERRLQEWIFQRDTAKKELLQIDKQILASQIREQLADQELTHHEQQIDNSRQVADFMRSKYTQEELYGWMIGEVSTIYFQCYQLAYDLARKAEKTYRYELGITESNFVQFGVWDSFRKGLLSGERLYLSLKQLEKAYMDQNRREYELTKHISFMQHFPLALLQLKANGSCIIELPENLFDADYPGQYMRRIKNVSLSIPCVVGPYTSINCTLSLLNSKIRSKNSLKGTVYKESPVNQDERFIYQFGAIQSIATSHAQNDSGLFELNFRDERYLPFEYGGAISRLKIDLPADTNAFDFITISDVILHLKYTAREAGKVLKEQALKELKTIGPDPVLLSVKHHFAPDWYQYSQANKGRPINELTDLSLKISSEQLPFFARNAKISGEENSSKAYILKQDGAMDLTTTQPVKVDNDGRSIKVKLSEKVEDVADLFLIMNLV